jgi:two-component system NtrC family sensor kinase
MRISQNRISLWKKVMLTGWVLIIAIVGLLLFLNFRSETALQKETIVRMEASLRGWAASVDGYLQGRKNNICTLSRSNVIERFFNNRALGMSMRDGLQESLKKIEQKFSEIVENKRYALSSHFSAICLFDKQGELLVSSTRKGVDTDKIAAVSSKISDDTPMTVRSFIPQGEDDSFLLIRVQVKHVDEQVGSLVGLIPLADLYNHSFPQKLESSAMGIIDFVILKNQNRIIFAPADTGIAKIELENIVTYETDIAPRPFTVTSHGKASRVHVFRDEIKGDKLSLFWVIEDHLVFRESNAKLLIVLTSILIVIIFASINLALHKVAQANLLEVRLDESAKKRLETEQQAALLKSEIQRREEIQAQLLDGKVLLHSLIDSIPDMIFYKSKALAYQGCNRAFADFVDKPVEDIGGSRSGDLFSPDYCEIFDKNDHSVLNYKQHVRYESIVRRENDDPIDLEITKFPYYSPGNEVIGLIGICRDITPRKRIEKEIRQKEERLSLVIHATDVGMWDWDVQSGRIFFNERWAEIIGYTLAELGPLSIDTWVDRTHPEDLALAEKLLEEQFDKKTEYYDCELRMKHKNGHWVWIHDRGKVVDWTEDGKPLRMTGTHSDITRRKLVETELKQLNETLEQRVEKRSNELNTALSRLMMQEKLVSIGQLAAGIAHELNNPINFIRVNFVSLREYFASLVRWQKVCREALDQIESDQAALVNRRLAEVERSLGFDFLLKDFPELFNQSEKGFVRVANIIGAMRNFSREEDQEQYAPVDINSCLQDTLIISKHEYKYIADVELQLGQVSPIDGIAQQLNQVFLNLIVNAAQAIQAAQLQSDGLITIKTWQKNDMVFCSVQDNGTGIAKENLKHLFEPFFTTKAPGKGTGLGLSISYDIVVNKHQGELKCQNNDGDGACFTLWLPARQAKHSP